MSTVTTEVQPAPSGAYACATSAGGALQVPLIDVPSPKSSAQLAMSRCATAAANRSVWPTTQLVSNPPPLPPVTPEAGGLEHEDRVDLPARRRGDHRLVAWPVLAIQGGDVIVDLRADNHEAPGIGDPLLIGQLVGDAVLITRLVEADPGIPRAADNLRLHDVLS